MRIGNWCTFEVSDYIDVNGEVEFEMESGHQYLYDFVDKEDAIKLINHLKKVFELGD